MEPAAEVRHFLTRIARRHRLLYLARAALATLAGGALLLALLGVLGDATVSPMAATVLWGTWGAFCVGLAVWSSVPLWRRPMAAPDYIHRIAPRLASEAQSVVDFAHQEQPSNASAALVRAHAASTWAQLQEESPGTYVDSRDLWPPIWRWGILLTAVTALLLFLSGEARLGLYALFHPSEIQSEAATMADFVGELRWEGRLPDYLQTPLVGEVTADALAPGDLLPPAIHPDGTEGTLPSAEGSAGLFETAAAEVRVPAGTALTVHLESRIPLSAPTLHIGDARYALVAEGPQHFVARLEAETSGEVRIEGRNAEGRPLQDASPRHLEVIPDTPPQIAVHRLIDGAGPMDETPQAETAEAPPDDVEAVPAGSDAEAEEFVAADEEVHLAVQAEDDYGLANLRLVVRGPGGEVIRRELWRSDKGAPAYDGYASFRVTETGARPGDALHVWVEGSDHNDIDGPGLGRSADLRLVVESESRRRDGLRRSLSEATNFGLDALADRLESPDMTAPRRGLVQDSTNAFANAVQEVAQEAESGAAIEMVDGSVLRALARRLRRLLTQEQRAPAEDQRRAAAIDGRLVSQLEADVLFLADLTAQVQLDDVAALARELDSLRREMTSLLEELQRSDTPEARRELLAAISRARARLAELAARMAAMGENGPSEFLNPQDVDTQASSDALAAIDEAVRGGEFDRAEAELLELRRQIDQMVSHLDESAGTFGESRMGPREEAMAEALDRLAGLETEQLSLSRRSERSRQEAAEAALEAAGDRIQEAARRLETSAEETAALLRRVPEDRLGLFDRETRNLAIARIEDAAAALAQGDLGEAREMAEASLRNAQRLARELELSAMMYPGREGGTAEAASRAREAARASDELGRALDDAIPEVAEHVAESGSQQLREDRPRQNAARQASDELEALFRSEPDGNPLSPEGADAMGRAGAAMEAAEAAMERTHPMDAARAQAEAARELSELRDRLEQQQQQQQQSGGGGGASTPRPRVELTSDARSEDRRREILDAMQAGSPQGFEEANRRYYEGLLR